MRLQLTPAGSGLYIVQGGLGPIIELGFGDAGQPANLSAAPVVQASLPDDLVLIQRNGQLQQIASGVFAAGLSGDLLSSTFASFGQLSVDQQIAFTGLVLGVFAQMPALQQTAFINAALKAMPASPAGLNVGDWWNNDGTAEQIQ